MNEFKPPIAARSTKDLLKIVGAVEKWNSEAIEQAKIELKQRNVSEDQIEHAKYISRKEDRYEDLKRAKESYTVCGFIDKPILTFFEILFSWELKKDGFLKKAEQQKRMRVIILLLILVLIGYKALFK